MTWQEDVRRANEALDWIEARQGPLKPDGYARIETTVQQVRAMASEQADDAWISEIRSRHYAFTLSGGQEACFQCIDDMRPDSTLQDWPCDTAYLLNRLIRAEEANTAVIRANAEEIADLEDKRDELEAQVNALTAQMECRNELTARIRALEVENERGQQAFADLTLASAERINALTAERDRLRLGMESWRTAAQSNLQAHPADVQRLTDERDALRGWQATVLKYAALRGWRAFHDNATNAPRRCTGCGAIRHLPRNAPGWPDLVLVRRPDVLFVELKSDSGKLDDDQAAWLDDLRACGQRVYVWRPEDWPTVQEVLL